jgi:alkyl sulfatase BDS1-like metallo-beta-lactamase superfamily hydrolase
VIELPETLRRKWYNRGYHGTLHHDVWAAFTEELGMADADPVSLHSHTPVDSAKRYVDLIGADAILAAGRRAYEAANYRWATEILHKLVFNDPDNMEARNVQADAFEQMGYQVEGPQWRGIFLAAAPGAPCRHHPRPLQHRRSGHGPRDADRHPLHYAAVQVIRDKAADADIQIDFTFTDLDETWSAHIHNGVLNARQRVTRTRRSPCRDRSRHSWRPSSSQRPPRSWPRSATSPGTGNHQNQVTGAHRDGH